MALLPSFDFDAVQTNDFAPLPVGEYTAAIVESEEKQTKAGTGSYLNLTLEVIEGNFKGRKVWERLNLNNPNQTAVNIAQQTLKAIHIAQGKSSPALDSSELHNVPMKIKVTVRDDPQYGPSNEIKAYGPVGSAPAPQPAAAPHPVPQPAPVAHGATATQPSWAQ